jgi:ADP-ribose pyrophosphatase
MNMEWTIEKSDIVVDDKWLRVRADKCRMPDGQVVEPYYVLEYPNWINVFGITKEKDVILVKIYRHDIGQTVVELPSGTIESADKSAMDAAKREFLEETGYSSENFVQTGVVSPNSANHSNLTYCFLARGLELVRSPKLDKTEQIETLIIPFEESVDMLRTGKFLQAMHVSSVYYALSYLNEIE